MARPCGVVHDWYTLASTCTYTCLPACMGCRCSRYTTVKACGPDRDCIWLEDMPDSTPSGTCYLRDAVKGESCMAWPGRRRAGAHTFMPACLGRRAAHGTACPAPICPAGCWLADALCLWGSGCHAMRMSAHMSLLRMAAAALHGWQNKAAPWHCIPLCSG